MDWCVEPEGVYRSGEGKLEECAFAVFPIKTCRGPSRTQTEVCATGNQACNENGRDAVELVMAGKAPALYACQRVTYT